MAVVSPRSTSRRRDSGPLLQTILFPGVAGERLTQGSSEDDCQFDAIDSCPTLEGLYSGSAYRHIRAWSSGELVGILECLVDIVHDLRGVGSWSGVDVAQVVAAFEKPMMSENRTERAYTSLVFVG